MAQIADLQAALTARAASLYENLIESFGEITLECTPKQYRDLLYLLRDDESLHFEQALDLCGVDYLTYRNETRSGKRFAVVLHLLSLKHNRRLRVRVFPEEGQIPLVPSAVDIYNGLDWYEREAFDMFGIVFDGHPDLRRILTDYNFVGNPCRKDFPVSGYAEMIYDEKQQRVIYQPVTIEPREITPRIVREEHYGGY